MTTPPGQAQYDVDPMRLISKLQVNVSILTQDNIIKSAAIDQLQADNARLAGQVTELQARLTEATTPAEAAAVAASPGPEQ
jgi:hypothetical protein